MSERRLPTTILRATFLRVAFLLAFVITVHQFVMATSAHEAIMPMMNHPMQTQGPIQDAHTCPYCPLHTTTICPAVQAILVAGMGVVFFLAVMIAAIAFFLRGAGAAVIASADWRPPPKCTLVLLQTFRC